VSGDQLQSLLVPNPNPHVPGATGDYAACTGDTNGTIDYYPGMNGTTDATAANGAFVYFGYRITFQSITDGLGNTIFVGEKHVPKMAYGASPDSSVYNGDNGASHRQAGVGAPLANGPYGTGQFGSYHPGVCLFAMGDASVRAISTGIDLANLSYLANRHDEQIITYKFE